MSRICLDYMHFVFARHRIILCTATHPTHTHTCSSAANVYTSFASLPDFTRAVKTIRTRRAEGAASAVIWVFSANTLCNGGKQNRKKIVATIRTQRERMSRVIPAFEILDLNSELDSEKAVTNRRWGVA